VIKLHHLMGRSTAYVVAAVLGIAGIGGLSSALAQQTQNGSSGSGSGTASGSNSGANANSQNATGTNVQQNATNQNCVGANCTNNNITNQNQNVTPQATVRRVFVGRSEEARPVVAEPRFGG
jgi:predicted nucleotide-binding protein